MIAALRTVTGLLALVIVHAADQAPDGAAFHPLIVISTAVAVLLVTVPCLFDLTTDRERRMARRAEARAKAAEARIEEARAIARQYFDQQPTREPVS